MLFCAAVQAIQYISDLGGVFGLWFGFALMTFVEMCEFVTDLLLLMVYTLSLIHI